MADDPTFQCLDELIAAPAPLRQGFNPSISPQAAMHIGLIIAQWGALVWRLNFETKMYRGHFNIPEPLRLPPRDNVRAKVNHLRLIAPYILDGERAGSVELYDRNLARILMHKGVRDALAHGMFTLTDNQGFNGAVVHYKNHKLRLSMKRLQQVSTEIGECHVFLSNFWAWVHAARNREMFQALMEKSPPHDAQDSPHENPDTP